MRSSFLLMFAGGSLLLACGGAPDDLLDGSGGSAAATGGSVAGESGGQASGGESTGGSQVTGGTDAGGTGGAETGGVQNTGGQTSSGGPGTGGAQETGGADTGGSPSGGAGSGGAGGTATGGEPALDPCDPPELTDVYLQVGEDLNGYCGWTADTAPHGYGPSPSAGLDCSKDPFFTGQSRDLSAGDRDTYVAVIDPSERCDGMADRRFTMERYFCAKFSNPFATAINDDTSECVVVDADLVGTTRVFVNAEAPSWLRVDVFDMVDGVCPVSCE